MKEKSKIRIVNFLFWFSILVFFSPFIFYHYFNFIFLRNLDVSLSKTWEIQTDIQKFEADLPTKINNYSGRIIYKKDIPVSYFEKFNNPAIFLGRIGDSDKFFINDCLVGVTGYDNSGHLQGYWWNSLRMYNLPKDCLKENNVLRVEVEKIGGPGIGIFGGPVGIIDGDVGKHFFVIIDYLWSKIFIVYGFILIAISIYYLLIYNLIRANKYNLYFSLAALFIGLFEIITSAIPYRYIDNGVTTLKLNLLFSTLGGYFAIKFFDEKYILIKKNNFLIKLITIGPLLGLLFSSFNVVYDFYQAWFVFYVLTLGVTFYLFVKFCRKVKVLDGWRYLLGFLLFFLTVIHDTATTAFSISTPYLVPYGFAIVIIVSAITLAKEYADAFLHVEAQVGERTKDLSSALEQLRGLEKMKERFFANVSHDLKTPITIALGAIEDTKNQFINVIGRALEPADRSLKRLQDMVMGILDTVKAESGTLQLDWKSVKIADFLQNIIDPYKSLCAKEGVQLKYSTEGFGGLYVPLDPSKIERVIENLLSNAIKFTKRTTRAQKVIEVSLHTDQSKLYIYIDDSGIGIPAGEHEKVFERYFQSSRTNLREHGGSGIGLSFVREMVSLHNGKVYASDSPYMGTRFTIELPLSQSVENIQSYRIEETGEKVLRGSLDVEYPATKPSKINQALPFILVAEDNPEVAQVVYSTLEGKYNVFFAENGKRAFQIMGEQEFDCVVSDIQMPEMTGDELVECIRKETRWKSIPIIMLSSHGDDDTIVKLLKMGANDYVQKPFRREILLSRIQAQINAYKGTTWNTKLEKLQELGQLVSGIGHQGKNRIGRVGSNYPLLIKIAKDLAKKLEATNPEEGKKIAEKIQVVGDLIGKGYYQTVDLFKAIDRYASGSEKKTVISIEEIVSDTLTLLEEKIVQKGVTIQTSIPSGLSFEGYNEFREAILNIISNSIDAVEEKSGKITIKAEEHSSQIVISIQDNGSGIPKENIARVFEPFFTSKKIGQGTGLGLYLARDAVELKNQGKLTIESGGEGRGTTVHIQVPKVVSDVSQNRPTMHNVDV